MWDKVDFVGISFDDDLALCDCRRFIFHNELPVCSGQVQFHCRMTLQIGKKYKRILTRRNCIWLLVIFGIACAMFTANMLTYGNWQYTCSGNNCFVRTMLVQAVVTSRAVGCEHYGDVIMGAIASQITSLTIFYSTFYSGADQSKHQSSASTGLCVGNSPGTGEFPAQMASNAENASI